MEKCRFSFVVPVYNVEPYLARCVESMLSQEFEAYEILLVDDGSTDGSGELCDAYAAQNPGIRAFHKVNGGLSSARNYGMKQARGEYLLFVDSDDYVDHEMCQTLDGYLRREEEIDLVSFDGMEEWDAGSSGIRRIPAGQVSIMDGREYLLEGYRNRNMNVQAWLYAYRREFLESENLVFREGILHEDVEYMPRVLLKAEKVMKIPDRFYHYVIREHSISTASKKEKNIQDLFATLKNQCRLAEKQDPELEKWMKNAALDSYLNMIQEARMYRPEYRMLLEKEFLLGKAATGWNRFRAALCFINVWLYCHVNDWYKKLS